jgi:hypothetical protein
VGKYRSAAIVVNGHPISIQPTRASVELVSEQNKSRTYRLELSTATPGFVVVFVNDEQIGRHVQLGYLTDRDAAVVEFDCEDPVQLASLARVLLTDATNRTTISHDRTFEKFKRTLTSFVDVVRRDGSYEISGDKFSEICLRSKGNVIRVRGTWRPYTDLSLEALTRTVGESD